MSTPKPCFSDELMLAGWSETSTGGAKVTFFLPDAAALDVFRQMTVKKGNTAGQRFACVLVEIGDDEQPVTPDDAPKAATKGPYGDYYRKLGKTGWFNSTGVKTTFGANQITIKQHFYNAFHVDSLSKIRPSEFRSYVESYGLRWTLPNEQADAA